MTSQRPFLALVVALVVSGCIGGAPSTPSASPPVGPTTAPATASPTLPATFRAPGNDAFGQLINEATGDFQPAGSDLDTMWSHIFERSQIEGQRPYVPPTGVAPYLASEPPPVKCVVGKWANNAFYCPADSWIVYDEDFLRAFESSAGPYAPAAILSHEWGHHIQNLIGGGEFSIQKELQADCFAGMYLAYREMPDGVLFNPHNDEVLAALFAMFSLANKKYSESTWFAAREHGGPIQRMLAFGTGSLPIDGMSWCYGYQDYVAGDVSAIGPHYRLINLPGREELPTTNGLVIKPETRTGDDSSFISMGWLSDLPLVGQGATPEQWTEVAQKYLPAGSIYQGDVDLTGNVAPGTGYMRLYQPPEGAAQPRSGLFALIVPASGDGGLLIDVSRFNAGPQDVPDATPSPEAMAVLAEESAAVYQVLTRLCGPDQSADVNSPQFSTSCVNDV